MRCCEEETWGSNMQQRRIKWGGKSHLLCRRLLEQLGFGGTWRGSAVHAAAHQASSVTGGQPEGQWPVTSANARWGGPSWLQLYLQMAHARSALRPLFLLQTMLATCSPLADWTWTDRGRKVVSTLAQKVPRLLSALRVPGALGGVSGLVPATRTQLPPFPVPVL